MCLMGSQKITLPLVKLELIREQLLNRKARFADTLCSVLGRADEDVIQLVRQKRAMARP